MCIAQFENRTESIVSTSTEKFLLKIVEEGIKKRDDFVHQC